MTQTLPDGGPELSQADYNALVHFKRARVEPWSAVYVTLDDTIVVRLWSPAANTTARISLRYQDPDGAVLPQFYTLIVNAGAAVPGVLAIPGAEGYLLSASVETPGIPGGQAYAMIELVRGQGTQDVTRGHLLLAGYPGSGYRLGFPQMPPRLPLDGVGFVNQVTQANPAAGADFAFTVPVGEAWKFYSVSGTLVTAVAIATRIPFLIVDDGAAVPGVEVDTGQSQAAALTVIWSWFHGATTALAGGVANAPLPLPFPLPSGSRARTLTTGIQPADQWSNVRAIVERFVAG